LDQDSLANVLNSNTLIFPIKDNEIENCADKQGFDQGEEDEEHDKSSIKGDVSCDDVSIDFDSDS